MCHLTRLLRSDCSGPRISRRGRGFEYRVENESYGLATMCKQHVTVARDGEMIFDYPA